MRIFTGFVNWNLLPGVHPIPVPSPEGATLRGKLRFHPHETGAPAALIAVPVVVAAAGATGVRPALAGFPSYEQTLASQHGLHHPADGMEYGMEFRDQHGM
jgi:hypothetical protein